MLPHAALAVVDADPVEGGDRPRGHQDRIGPGGVLVVAGREEEAPLLDEGTPVRLVPGDHEELEDLGPVGERERGRSVLRETVRVLIAHGLARPVRAGVVVDEDVGAAGLLDAFRDRLERARCEGVVAVEEEDVVAGGVFEARVAGPAEPHVLPQTHRPHPLVPRRELVGDRPARVRRAVVDRDHLKIGTRLFQDGFEARVQVGLHLVHGDDDTEPGQGTSMGRHGAYCPATADGVIRLRQMWHTGDLGNRRGRTVTGPPLNSLVDAAISPLLPSHRTRTAAGRRRTRPAGSPWR